MNDDVFFSTLAETRIELLAMPKIDGYCTVLHTNFLIELIKRFDALMNTQNSGDLGALLASKSFDDLNKRLDAQCNDIDDIKREIESIKANIIAVSTRTNDYGRSLIKMAALEGQIIELKTSHTGQGQEIINTNERLDQFCDTITIINTHFDALEAKVKNVVFKSEKAVHKPE